MEERMQRDTCYNCKKRGHWSNKCPDKKPNKAGPSSGNGQSSSAAGAGVREKECPCGAGVCNVWTSHTENNPNRKFYKCPAKTDQCNFFEWCDLAKFENKDVPVPVPVPVPYPDCSCGAGKCSRFTVRKDGRNKGRNFFVCPVKKGQGACNFFQWEDTPVNVMSDESKPLDSQKAVAGQEETKTRNMIIDGDGNGNGVGGRIISPTSAEKGTGSSLPRKTHAKEEMVGPNSCADALLIPMENLRVSEKVTSVAAKPGKCYRCDKEGHWAANCLKSFTNSICFKCGKKGHWMARCPN